MEEIELLGELARKSEKNVIIYDKMAWGTRLDLEFCYEIFRNILYYDFTPSKKTKPNSKIEILVLTLLYIDGPSLKRFI